MGEPDDAGFPAPIPLWAGAAGAGARFAAACAVGVIVVITPVVVPVLPAGFWVTAVWLIVFVTFTPVKVPERAVTTIGMLGSTGAVPAGVIVAEAMAHPLV